MEQEFILVYHVPGITVADVQLMPTRERKWHIRRLQKERKEENERARKANKAR